MERLGVRRTNLLPCYHETLGVALLICLFIFHESCPRPDGVRELFTFDKIIREGRRKRKVERERRKDWTDTGKFDVTTKLLMTKKEIMFLSD